MAQDFLPTTTAVRRDEPVLNENRAALAQHIPPSAAPEPVEVIGRYLATLRRYKWLVLAILAVGSFASVGATRFVEPRYEVHATIWIASQTPQGKTVGPFRAEELVNSSAWPDLLTSYAILDSVVIKAGLFVRPDDSTNAAAFTDFRLGDRFRPGDYRLSTDAATRKYTLLTEKGEKLEQGTVGDSIGRSLGFRWAPTSALMRDRTLKFKVVPPRTASIALRGNLQAILPPNANLLRVQLQGAEPEVIARTTNALLHQFVATAATLKNRNLIELAAALERQLNYAETQLREAEIALENFRVNTITLPSEGGPVASGVQLTRDPVLTSYFGQKIEYDNVVQDRALLEQMLTQLRAGTLDLSSLWLVNSVQSGPPELRNALSEYAAKTAALRAARQVFTDEHRSVRELDAAIRTLREQTIPQLGVSLVNELREKELALSKRIGSAGNELRQIPTRTIEEMRLTRNVVVRENLYTTLKNRYEEARLASASSIPDVSILDSAVTPQAPSTNSAPRVIALGVLGSFGFAVLLALALDRFDARFRYPEQVSRDLRLPILGVVPAITRGAQSFNETTQVVESFRSIRLSLSNAFAETGVPMVTVSSPGPGDGKSLVCANIAISFADGGYRTLLIDGDIRRGDLHNTLGVDRTPGLIDVLLGAATIEQSVQLTDTPRLSVLPSGSRRQRGPELLASEQLPRLMAELRKRFDVVIVDSAPLGAGIDGFALAAATRNLVLVMRSERTDRKLAEAKLRVLDRLPVYVLGAVLNGIRAEGAYRYYGYVGRYASDRDEPTVVVVGTGNKQVSVV